MKTTNKAFSELLKDIISEAIDGLPEDIVSSVTDINHRVSAECSVRGVDVFIDGELLTTAQWVDEDGKHILEDGVTLDVECGLVKKAPELCRSFSNKLKGIAALIDEELTRIKQ